MRSGTEHRVMKKVVHVEVDLGRLYGRRGVLCGLLAAAVITTVVCLAVFTAKHNEISSLWRTGDVCTLFLTKDNFLVPTNGPISVCQYVIGGSATVMVLLLCLLIETLLVVFFAFAFTDHLVAILLRGTAVFLSLVLMLCVSVVITAGVSTTCVSASQSLLRLACADLNYSGTDSTTSFLGSMVASAIFGWIATGLLIAILVMVGAPLKSRVTNISSLKKSLLRN